jgi:hypothetical protein
MKFCIIPSCIMSWNFIGFMSPLMNLCVTHSGMMHLILTCEVCGFQIVQHILDNLGMTTDVYYLISVSCIFRS